MSDERLSAAEVRALVIGAQFAPSFGDAAEVLTHTGILQLDPLARVEKAHRLTALTRLGPRARAKRIDAQLWRDDVAVAFETVSRIACLVPVGDWPLHRLERERAAGTVEPELRDRILAIVSSLPDGATIGDIETGTASQRTTGWEWSPVKIATEHLLRQGELVVTTRRGVARVFDLPERRLPAAAARVRLDDAEVLAGLAHRALRSLGVVTVGDLTRVFRLTRAQAEAGLESAGAVRASVEGWRETAYVDRDAAVLSTSPHEVAPLDGPRLVGPFDQLLRDRARAQRVFGFDYTFEAYKPVADRVHGHYVLGVLAGDRFVGRVDARRDGPALLLGEVVPERGMRRRSAAAAARRAGRRLARQLELELTEPTP
ncbi:hypothetical protein HNR16_002748 [Pseudoclavibacter chungangensis]|uniref:DNA glycosylase AlkZ-like family protein n=1 Tax=Pseudoclavibacter chungangensis TaxID=587635 RepID=UPI0015CDC3AC|nr:crosslink repair DNA glycosylase YcaQ family protein [Pseudoclavibacter chungangensis]NYJ67960.1 hypothetical protein [Pseudoclavibacter chungangensis]